MQETGEYWDGHLVSYDSMDMMDGHREELYRFIHGSRYMTGKWLAELDSKLLWRPQQRLLVQSDPLERKSE